MISAEPRWDILMRRAEIRRFYAPSRDGMFLAVEPKYDVLTHRAEIGRSYEPSLDGTFLILPDEMCHVR